MHRLFKYFIIFSAIVTHTGCTSMQVIYDVNQGNSLPIETLADSITQKSEITLTTSKGDKLKVHLIDITEETLTGNIIDSADHITFPFGELTMIEQKQLSGLMTVILAISVAVGIRIMVEAVLEASVAASL